MINIQNLSFGYPKHVVFRDVNLSLEQGRIYGLLGQNGVGKTTLLKLISGLLKNNGGNCLVNGMNPFDRQPDFLKDIYYLPEDPVPLKQEVESFVKSIGHFYPRFDIDLFYKLMNTFDVNPKAAFNKLSQGQAKKAMISVALSLKTGLLLMDEPSNGLDIPSKTQFRKVISDFADENTTIIISTHQVRDLENLIDPIIILDKEEGVLLNASIEEISQKLYFSIDMDNDDKALYCEPTFGGYAKVYENVQGIESKVNIESLFNTVLINKSRIKELFSK